MGESTGNDLVEHFVFSFAVIDYSNCGSFHFLHLHAATLHLRPCTSHLRVRTLHSMMPTAIASADHAQNLPTRFDS